MAPADARRKDGDGESDDLDDPVAHLALQERGGSPEAGATC